MKTNSVSLLELFMSDETQLISLYCHCELLYYEHKREEIPFGVSNSSLTA